MIDTMTETAPPPALWEKCLDELLAVPYAGRGGPKALAAALEIPLYTLRGYTQRRRRPSYGNIQKIRGLWEQHFADKGDD